MIAVICAWVRSVRSSRSCAPRSMGDASARSALARCVAFMEAAWRVRCWMTRTGQSISRSF